MVSGGHAILEYTMAVSLDRRPRNSIQWIAIFPKFLHLIRLIVHNVKQEVELVR